MCGWLTRPFRAGTGRQRSPWSTRESSGHSCARIDPYAEGIGPTGLLSYWATIFRKYRVRPRAYLPRGDYVVVPLDLHGRGGRASGHLEEVWSTCVTGGKIRSVHEYETVEQALEAADAATVDQRRRR